MRPSHPSLLLRRTPPIAMRSTVCLLLAALFPTVHALSLGCPVHVAALVVARAPPVRLGLFDFFTESAEQKAAKEAAREAEFKAQQEMLARRRNPELREEYEREVVERRAAASAKDAELKELQKSGDFAAWERLRAEGKLQSADETERDEGSSRLGSAGLIAERIDEKLPFIDSGYVDEAAPDVMSSVRKLFGGGSGADTADTDKGGNEAKGGSGVGN